MGGVCCKQGSSETFNLETDPGTNRDSGPDGPVIAKTGNFAMATNAYTEGNLLSENTDRKSPRKLDKKQNFVEHFLKEVNSCRANPSLFAEKVLNHVQYIQENEAKSAKNSAFYIREGMPKIPLTRGASAFQELAERLRNMEPMTKIELRTNLEVTIPEDPANWTSKQYIGETLAKLKAENKVNHEYQHFNFHYDVGSPYSENSFILQLVDDTPFKGARSKNLLNPEFKYVGITSQKVKNRHCGYFLFAN